jgi:hypothetical protein
LNKRRQTIQDKKKEKESTTKGKLDEIFLEIEHFSFNVVTNKEI